MANPLLERFNEVKRPLVLDGAMGSLLQQRGVPVEGSLWSAAANINYPDEVIKIHSEYIDAGADIITSNTFRTNPYAISQSGITVPLNIVEKSIELARQSIGENNIILAGSNAPAEDCYQTQRTMNNSDLYDNHKSHIEQLCNNKVDLIWNETFGHLDEIIIVCEICAGLQIPYTINMFFDFNLKLLSSEPVSEVISVIKQYNPVAIGFNCISPQTFSKLLSEIKVPVQFGYYLNCGSGNYTDAIIETGFTPIKYAELLKSNKNLTPLYIGSCCGSTPEHTKKIKETILELYSN